MEGALDVVLDENGTDADFWGDCVEAGEESECEGDGTGASPGRKRLELLSVVGSFAAMKGHGSQTGEDAGD